MADRNTGVLQGQIDSGGSLPSTVQAYGRHRISTATIEFENGDAAASTYSYFIVPGNASILSVKTFSDAVTGADSVSIGIKDTERWGGNVRDADLFGSAIDLSAADTVGTERRFTNTVDAGIETSGTKLSALLGLNTDAELEEQGRPEDFVLFLTSANAITATGNVTLQVTYVVD